MSLGSKLVILKLELRHKTGSQRRVSESEGGERRPKRVGLAGRWDGDKPGGE